MPVTLALARLSSGGMRVLVAPDKFKGSLTGVQAAEAIAAGVLAASPAAGVILRPIADGGEGTVDAAVAASFRRLTATVSGPLGSPVEAAFAVRDDLAVMELAQACGLQLLGERPEPLRSTSRGGGELLRAAVDAGARRVVLGVGGVACTDGGVGMLEALGAAFTDNSVDLAPAREAVRGIEVVLASDVDNPLLGPHGAARVYGPQKGATPEEVELLEARLQHLVDLTGATDVAVAPGAGAAGGVGFGAMLGLGAQQRPGFEVLAELTGLSEVLETTDLVITGEGSLDEQSLRGKAPVALARMAAARGIPVVALCGRVAATHEQLAEAGIQRAEALTDLDPQRAMTHAAELLRQLGVRAAQYWTT